MTQVVFFDSGYTVSMDTVNAFIDSVGATKLPYTAYCAVAECRCGYATAGVQKEPPLLVFAYMGLEVDSYPPPFEGAETVREFDSLHWIELEVFQLRREN